MTSTPLDTRSLPEAFVEAANRMRSAFAYGDDDECDAAAHALTAELRALPTDLTAPADELLVSLAAAAAAEAATARVASQLRDATVTGTRPLPGNQEVRTLLLPDGTEVAVVVPTGTTPAATAARDALLTGTCARCSAGLSVNWQIVHEPGCVASLHR